MFDKFKSNIGKTDSRLCVGLDTDATRAPLADLGDFNKAIIDAVGEYAACFKLQMAFYEAQGERGLALLRDTVAYIRAHLPATPIIGDAKRCDVGHSASAYAVALYEELGFDCVTLLPYLGTDALQPFLRHADRSAFVVCHTSNPSAKRIQQLEVRSDAGDAAGDGERLYEHVARMTAALDPKGERLGLVVGATYIEPLANLRRRHPRVMFLIPGVGAQGGDLERAVKAAAGVDHGGDWKLADEGGDFVVNVSRAILYASEDKRDFARAAGASARYFQAAIQKVLTEAGA